MFLLQNSRLRLSFPIKSWKKNRAYPIGEEVFDNEETQDVNDPQSLPPEC